MMKETLISFLFLSFSLSVLSLQTNFLSSMKSKSLIQTSIKLRTLSTYLNEYSQLEISLNEIANYTTLYAYYNKTSKKIAVHSIPNKEHGLIVAQATYEKNRFKNGWDRFTSKTFNVSNPIIQCYSVGVLEGILSQEEIYDYRHNFEMFFDSEKDINDLKDFFKQGDSNIKNKINEVTNDYRAEDIKTTAFLSCVHAQINGLYQGYSLKAKDEQKLDLYDLYLLNSEGYFSGLQNYLRANKANFQSTNDFFNEKTLIQYYNTSRIEDIWKKLIKKSHCSGIVKLIKNDKGECTNLFLGHNTWTGYNELLRTLKKIDYAFEGDNQVIGMAPIKMKYSSYPGILFSGDEFYTIGSNLAIIQTSLSIINTYQYKNAVNPMTYIPEFMRIMTINFLSRSGKEWVENYLSIYKGNHIYEAQWIAIDYNNLNKKSDLMYIVEEVPKSVKYVDYTKELIKKTYYGSFNVPFFKEDHATIAGLNSFNNVNFYNKQFNPRQYILDKFANKVRTLKDFKNLLMYNGYKTKQNDFIDDPSYDDPSNGLASREGDSNGAIDFKIVDKTMMKEDKLWVYSGPVYETNKHFEPYDVSKATQRVQDHSLGMPRVWKFKPFIFS